MKLQITRILKDELAKGGDKLPSWIDVLLQVLNSFIDQVGKCLKGQITFTDNILCKILTEKLTHNVEYQVSSAIQGKTGLRVIGVFPINAQGSSVSSALPDANMITGFGVNLKTNGNLGIVAKFSQGEGVSANVTFIIIYG